MRPLRDDPVEGLAAALADWVAGTGSGRDAGVEEARASLVLALAAAESLRTGQPVEVGG